MRGPGCAHSALGSAIPVGCRCRRHRATVQRRPLRRGARRRLSKRGHRARAGIRHTAGRFRRPGRPERIQRKGHEACVLPAGPELELHRWVLLELENRCFCLHTTAAGSLGKRYWFGTKPNLNKLVVQYRRQRAKENFEEAILEGLRAESQKGPLAGPGDSAALSPWRRAGRRPMAPTLHASLSRPDGAPGAGVSRSAGPCRRSCSGRRGSSGRSRRS
jgi:hypothetical protein